jgi:hypothetical protein
MQVTRLTADGLTVLTTAGLRDRRAGTTSIECCLVRAFYQSNSGGHLHSQTRVHILRCNQEHSQASLIF